MGIVHWPRFNDHIEPERVPSAVGRRAVWCGLERWVAGDQKCERCGDRAGILGWPGDAKQLDTPGDTGHDWDVPKSFVGLFLADVVG